MKLRNIIYIFVLFAFISGCGRSIEYSDTIIAMDTPMTLTAWGKGAEEAVNAAESEIRRLDGLFSTTNENSEIYRLNRSKTMQTSEDTYRLIKEAVGYGELTGHAIDITIYPVVKEWGFTTGDYKVPEDKRLEELKANVNCSEIKLDDDTMTVSVGEKTEIDLGAVAKGYASDRVMRIFEEMGVDAGLVSLGGNVQCMGDKPDGSLWKIAVADPVNEGEYAGFIELDEGAAVTSGNYQRYFEENGKRYHHIMDPSTCRPAENDLCSVTVISDDCTLADAYSTSLFVMGREKAVSFWKRNKGLFDVVFITKDGGIYITEGLKDSFTLADEGTDFEIIYAEK